MPEERSLRSSSIQIIAAAIIFSVVIHALVGTFYVQFSTRGLLEDLTLSAKTTIDAGLLLFAVACAAASFIMRRQFNRSLPANTTGRLAAKFRAVIVGMAIAEAGSVAALVHVLLLQDLAVAYVAWGIALAATILYFPTRSWLNEPGPHAQDSE